MLGICVFSIILNYFRISMALHKFWLPFYNLRTLNTNNMVSRDYDSVSTKTEGTALLKAQHILLLYTLVTKSI